jgi:DNA repair protein RadD
MYALRDYQQKAIDSVYKYLGEKPGNPCVVLPTGAGKTPVIATICRDAVVAWNGRVLVLAHVKELLQQAADKLRAICPMVKFGIYSAGLGKRETDAPVIIAGIQSVYDKGATLGRFDLIIVDEAHFIPEGKAKGRGTVAELLEGETSGNEGRYKRLIADLQEINPDLRVIGLTATHYRMTSGAICKPENILNEVCYEIGVKVLINRGFLSRMVSKAATNHIDSSILRIVRGEFDQAQAEAAFDAVAEAATAEILEKTQGRRSVLIFAQNIKHAKYIAGIIRKRNGDLDNEAAKQLAPASEAGYAVGDLFEKMVAADYLDDHEQPAEAVRALACGAFSVAEVYGDTPAAVRSEVLRRFKLGEIQYVVNVGVLTTGFDAPNVDAVALVRAFYSPGEYYQSVGRGLRICEGKTDCLVLDFGENVKRHGPIDCIQIRAAGSKSKGETNGGKECPECNSVMPIGFAVCTDCGYAFTSASSGGTHSKTAGEDDIISGKPKLERLEVMATTYRIHTKKGADENAPKTLRVSYQTSMTDSVSEWVCIEHAEGGFAHNKACDWWADRCYLPIPASVAEAYAMACQGWLAEPVAITQRTRAGERFPEIAKHELGDIPTAVHGCPKCDREGFQVIAANEDPRFPGRVICGGCEHLYRYATTEEIMAFGILDPANDKFGGEIRYELPEENIPAKAARGFKAEPVELDDSADCIPF